MYIASDKVTLATGPPTRFRIYFLSLYDDPYEDELFDPLQSKYT